MGSGDIQNDTNSINQEKLKSSPQGISLRVWIICLLIIFLITRFISTGYLTEEYMVPDYKVVPAALGIFAILILVLLNKLLGRFNKGLKPFELVAIYISASVATLIGMDAWVTTVLIKIASPYIIAVWDGDVGGMATYVDKLSESIIVMDREALQDFWAGGWHGVPWDVWIVPIMVWALFFGLIIFTLICLVSLFRHMWTNLEHLRYPINAPVLAIVGSYEANSNDPQQSSSFSLFKNKFLLLGLIPPLIYTGSRVFNMVWAGFPMFIDSVNMAEFVSEIELLEVLGIHHPLTFQFNPLLFGILGLLPLDMVFSFWFFSLFQYCLRVLTTIIYGETIWVDTFPAPRMQSLGGLLAMGLFLMWLARYQLLNSLRKAFGFHATDIMDENNEPFPYRAMWIGVIGGSILIILFVAYVLKTSMIWGGLIYFIAMGCSLLTYSRLRAESGYPSVFTANYAAGHYGSAFGAEIFSKWRHKGLIFFWQLEYSGLGTMGALALEGYKLADESNLKKSSLVWLIFATYFATIALGVYFVLPVIYEHGMDMLAHHPRAQEALVAQKAISRDGAPNIQMLSMWGAGALFTVFLYAMRITYIWWPFHPVGYVVSGNDFGHFVWGTALIVWIIKFAVYRYGGSVLGKKVSPFFVGSIIGYVTLTIISVIVGSILVYLK